MKIRKSAAAALCAAAVMGAVALSPAQASVSYEYALLGAGPSGGTMDFVLNNAPVFGNNIFQLAPASFVIHYDGIDFTQANGTLSQLDFIGGNLVNIIYNDNLPGLSFGTLGLGYGYLNSQERRDTHGGAGVFIGGDPDPTRVPEPASVALLLSGLLGAAFFFSRRAKAATTA